MRNRAEHAIQHGWVASLRLADETCYAAHAKSLA